MPPPPPPPPQSSEIGQCTTFKRNNARVDNACKEILQNRVVSALQADPTARLVIDGYRADMERPANLDLQRAKNVRDRLADGSLNVQIDVNRISVRPGGVSVDGNQVKIFFVPSGAADPPGPSAVDPAGRSPRRRRPPLNPEDAVKLKIRVGQAKVCPTLGCSDEERQALFYRLPFLH